PAVRAVRARGCESRLAGRGGNPAVGTGQWPHALLHARGDARAAARGYGDLVLATPGQARPGREGLTRPEEVARRRCVRGEDDEATPDPDGRPGACRRLLRTRSRTAGSRPGSDTAAGAGRASDAFDHPPRCAAAAAGSCS